MTKILGIDPNIREKILRTYLDKCKMAHFVAFQEWRREVHNEAFDPTFIFRKRQTIGSIDKKLFAGTEDVLALMESMDSPPRKSVAGHAPEHSRVSFVREKKSLGRNPDLLNVISEQTTVDGPPPLVYLPSKEIMQKMIRKATLVKKLEDLDYI